MLRNATSGRAFLFVSVVQTSLCPLQACGPTATFKSPSPRAGAELQALSVQAKCGQSKVEVDRKSLESTGGRMQVSGEICPTSSSSLHVLFVLDFSGSMQSNDPVTGSGSSASCGRSRAVKAIVDRLTASRGKDDKLSAGIVGFGTDATEVVGETDLAQFKPPVDSMCRSSGGVTNYRAAFDLAGRKLGASSKATRILYFISDGLPTAGGTSAPPIIIDPFDPFSAMNAMSAAAAMSNDSNYRAGSDAAAALRSQFPGLVFNALLLQPSATVSGDGADPAQYLATLTADASRVRIVSQAGQLADSAVQLLTVPVILDSGNVDAAVANDSGARQTLTVKQLLQSQESKGKWVFATSDFDARKMAGEDFAKVIHFSMDAAETSGHKQSLKFDLVVR